MVTVCVDSPVERNIQETMSGVEREGPVVIMKRCASKIENRSDRKDALASANSHNSSAFLQFRGSSAKKLQMSDAGGSGER